MRKRNVHKKDVIDVIFKRLDNIDRKIVEIEQIISDILRDDQPHLQYPILQYDRQYLHHAHNFQRDSQNMLCLSRWLFSREKCIG